MCGIAGIIDLTQQRAVPDEIVRRMARALVHRGPDEEGFFFQPGVALAGSSQWRLSVMSHSWWEPFGCRPSSGERFPWEWRP